MSKFKIDTKKTETVANTYFRPLGVDEGVFVYSSYRADAIFRQFPRHNLKYAPYRLPTHRKFS